MAPKASPETGKAKEAPAAAPTAPAAAGSKPWGMLGAVALCVGSLVAMSLMQPDGPVPAGPAQTAQSAGVMTERDFQLNMLGHWFPAESTEEPAADVQALLGLKGQEALDGGWTVRSVRVDQNSIRLELVQPMALFVLSITPAGNTRNPPVKTERYELSIVGQRPSQQAFTGLDPNKALEDVAARIRAREQSVAVPAGLRAAPLPPQPAVLPGTVIPGPPE